MGNDLSNIKKLNYEDMQFAIKMGYIVINTMPTNMQHCLIRGTVPIKEEEVVMNGLISSASSTAVVVVVYGKNSNDASMYRKYQQLVKLGFSNICVYMGGMFEWLLLQDIYGAELFPTLGHELDVLKYKPDGLFSTATTFSGRFIDNVPYNSAPSIPIYCGSGANSVNYRSKTRCNSSDDDNEDHHEDDSPGFAGFLRNFLTP